MGSGASSFNNNNKNTSQCSSEKPLILPIQPHRKLSQISQDSMSSASSSSPRLSYTAAAGGFVNNAPRRASRFQQMFEFNERETKAKQLLQQQQQQQLQKEEESKEHQEVNSSRNNIPLPLPLPFRTDSICGDFFRTTHRKNNSEGHNTRGDARTKRQQQQQQVNFQPSQQQQQSIATPAPRTNPLKRLRSDDAVQSNSFNFFERTRQKKLSSKVDSPISYMPTTTIPSAAETADPEELSSPPKLCSKSISCNDDENSYMNNLSSMSLSMKALSCMNIKTVSPLQKHAFRNRLRQNMHLQNCLEVASPVNNSDFSDAMHRSPNDSIELCEFEQLAAIRNSFFQEEELLDRNSDCGERSMSPRVTTFRSLSSGRTVKETSVINRSKQDGIKKVNEYEIGRVLGEGQYGKVRLGKVRRAKSMFDDNQKQPLEQSTSPAAWTTFAIKYFKKQQLRKMRQFYKDTNGRVKQFTGIQTVQSEIAVMKKLEHDNIVKLHEVIEDSDNDKIYLVIDYAENGQLIEYNESKQHFELQEVHTAKGTIPGEIAYAEVAEPKSDCSILDNLSGDDNDNDDDENEKDEPTPLIREKVMFIDEDILRRISRDCIKGLGYLHFNEVIHRDIKPQNILFTGNDVAVITDFSISLILGEQKVLKQDQGTLCFMAPELIERNTDAQKDDNVFYKRADVWSLGVTFFAFAFYSLPYKSTDLESLLEEITNNPLSFPSSRGEVSIELRDMLKSMLTVDPSQRITLEDLIDHPWINMGSGTSLLRDEIEIQEKIVICQNDIKTATTKKDQIAFLQKINSSTTVSPLGSFQMIDSCMSIQYDGVA